MRGTEDTVNPRHPWQQPRHGHGGVTGSILQLKPLRVLAFRALSDCVRRQAFHREQIAYGGRFQLLSVLLCAAVRAEGAASNRSKLCGRILICGVLSDYIHHGPIGRRKEPAIDGFEPLNILAFRAILDHIQRRVFHREPVQNGNFQLLSVLLCSAIRAKETAHDDRFKLCCILTCGAVSDYILREAINRRKEPAIDMLRDLPEGVLCTILSKLPLDEVVRTSAVSRNWRNLWTLCPKLSFDGSMMCGKNNYPERVHVLMFIRNVDRVLAQCRGKLVQELAVKINFNWTLIEHLNNWIPCLTPYQCEFSRMTYLQLRLLCVKKFHSLSLVYFLRSAPFVEKLELHFFTDYVHLVQESKPISKLPECLFNNMKSMHITGFKSYNDQVEFLLHMLENAPALEVLSIDHLDKYPLEGHEKDAKSVNFVPTTARRYLEGKIPPKCTLILLEEICW